MDASAESHVDDDAILRQCATAVVDIIAMQSSVRGIWNEEISMMLPETSDTANDEDVQPEGSVLHFLYEVTCTEVLAAALEHVLSGLGSLQSPLSTQIVSLLSKRCCDALLPVRSIPSQFRAMSNKRSPSEPSHFVPTIFRPIKVFFGIGAGDGYGAALKNEYLTAYAAEIFESVSQRYCVSTRGVHLTNLWEQIHPLYHRDEENRRVPTSVEEGEEVHLLLVWDCECGEG